MGILGNEDTILIQQRAMSRPFLSEMIKSLKKYHKRIKSLK